MNKLYIWQEDNWPNMTWQFDSFAELLSEVNLLRGKLLGRLSMFGFPEISSSMVDAMTLEIVHSAQIEGEQLDRNSVRSSVAQQLGLEDNNVTEDHYVEGVVQVLFDATQNYKDSLSAERLFNWHAALFPTGRSGAYSITVAEWRKGEEPMQVVSGAFGHQKVHYEAPNSDRVPSMMAEFLTWIDSASNIDPVLKAAVSHLWFVTIHPFDDGNGRLCRTVTEMLLSRADGTNQRFYSLSSEILHHRKQYYEALEQAQKGDLDITNWIAWFLHMLKGAIEASLLKTDNVIKKVAFWDAHRSVVINERQRKVINRLFDGFEGKLSSSKWAKMNHCSQDTASRDINDLIVKGILRKSEEGGRSSTYLLVENSVESI